MSDQQIETVNHLKKKLDKGVSFEKTMHILYKLQKIPISVKLLEATGIGYKLRELSKQEKDNDVGKTAKIIIMRWKRILRDQEQENESEAEVTGNQHNQQQQQYHNMDSQDNNDDHYEDNEENQICDERPGSDKSEEEHQNQMVSPNSKKKHKKKKKKSKDNSDNEEKEKKKNKKRKRERDNNETDRMDSKRYKNESSKVNHNKCDKVNGDSNVQSKWNKRESYESSTSTSSSSKYKLLNDDMFSAILNMGDQNNVIASKTSKTNWNKSNCNEESNQKNYYSSSIDKEIMQSLPYQTTSANRYDPNFYQYYQPQRFPNYETEKQTMNMAGIKFKGRTQVYAGSSKLVTVPEVYRLQDICIKVLMNHVGKIYEVGDLPYFLLKPVFAKCTVQQLRKIEHYNPQLLSETDELWRDFCEKDFKNKRINPEHFDSWRDFYNYLVDEREEKLKNITRNINSKQRQALPERKTQQIDLRTPREIRRRQEKSSTGSFAFRTNSTGNSKSINSTIQLKSKPAPLMKKALQMRYKNFRR